MPITKEQYNQLRQKIIEAVVDENGVPEITKLEFGCWLEFEGRKYVINDEQSTTNGETMVYWCDSGAKFYSDQVKGNKAYHGNLIADGEWWTILGRPIRLADCLRAYCLIIFGEIDIKKFPRSWVEKFRLFSCHLLGMWSLEKNTLEWHYNNKPETIKFLYDLLVNNKS